MAKRMAWVDWVNVAAALAVVFLHCNSFWKGPTQGRSWLSANFIETFFYPAVPLFLMNTGATLMEYRNRMNTKAYLKRRATRTVLPFIAWSLLGALFCDLYLGTEVDWSFFGIINAVANAKYVGIYWFFPALFACYLAMPLLSLALPFEKSLRYVLLCGILFVSLLPFACKLVGIDWNGNFTPPVVGHYMLYIAAGWLIANDKLALGPRRLRFLCVLGFCGFIAQLIGTHILSVEAGKVIKTFKGYTNLPCVLQSLALYACAKHMLGPILEQKGVWSKADDMIRKLSSLTFGVYLTHWYLIRIATTTLHVATTSIIWRSLGTIAVFLTSLFIVWLLKKIPIVRQIVP